MRWPACLILAYVMLGLQLGISGYVTIHGAAPNLALLAVLFIALNSRRDGALIAGFAIGFFQDLLSGQQPGLYACSYGIVAMIVVGAHRMVNRDHALTYFGLALVGGLITTLVVLTHSLFHPATPAVVEGKTVMRSVRISAGVEFTRLLYTAVLAPFVLVALRRMRDGFNPKRGSGRSRMREGR